MKVITRYVLRELIPNYFVGLAFFSVILVVNQIFISVKYIVERNAPADKVATMFLFSFPNIFSLAIPLAVAMASILSFSRLSADSEVVAMRGSGISLMRIILPNLYFGIAMFLFSLVFFDTILPWGNIQYVKTSLQLRVKDPMAEAEAREVVVVGNRSIRYEREDPHTKRMYDIHVTSPDGSITYARSGDFIEKKIVADKLIIRFRLYDVYTEELDSDKRELLEKTYSPVAVHTFVQHNFRGGTFQKSALTMTFGELLAKVKTYTVNDRHIDRRAGEEIKRQEILYRQAVQAQEAYRRTHPAEYKPPPPPTPQELAARRRQQEEARRRQEAFRKQQALRQRQNYPGNRIQNPAFRRRQQEAFRKQQALRQQQLQDPAFRRRQQEARRRQEAFRKQQALRQQQLQDPAVRRRQQEETRRRQEAFRKQQALRQQQLQDPGFQRRQQEEARRRQEVFRKQQALRQQQMRDPGFQRRQQEEARRRQDAFRRQHAGSPVQPPQVQNRAWHERQVNDARLRLKNARNRRQIRSSLTGMQAGDVYELHKKVSLPFACFIFTIIGAPLGMFSRRSGKSAGFGYGLGIMFFYWFLLVLGKGWVLTGTTGPVFSAWMPNVFLGVIGAVLIVKKIKE